MVNIKYLCIWCLLNYPLCATLLEMFSTRSFSPIFDPLLCSFTILGLLGQFCVTRFAPRTLLRGVGCALLIGFVGSLVWGAAVLVAGLWFQYSNVSMVISLASPVRPYLAICVTAPFFNGLLFPLAFVLQWFGTDGLKAARHAAEVRHAAAMRVPRIRTLRNKLQRSGAGRNIASVFMALMNLSCAGYLAFITFVSWKLKGLNGRPSEIWGFWPEIQQMWPFVSRYGLSPFMRHMVALVPTPGLDRFIPWGFAERSYEAWSNAEMAVYSVTTVLLLLLACGLFIRCRWAFRAQLLVAVIAILELLHDQLQDIGGSIGAFRSSAWQTMSTRVLALAVALSFGLAAWRGRNTTRTGLPARPAQDVPALPPSYFRLRYYFVGVSICLFLATIGSHYEFWPFVTSLCLPVPYLTLAQLSRKPKLRAMVGGAAIGYGIVALLLLTLLVFLVFWSMLWGDSHQLFNEMVAAAIPLHLLIVVEGFAALRGVEDRTVVVSSAILTPVLFGAWFLLVAYAGNLCSQIR